MATGKTIYVKSKYKHIIGMANSCSDNVKWAINKYGVGRNGFDNEREAAIAVDKYLISKGKEPVNILKRV